MPKNNLKNEDLQNALNAFDFGGTVKSVVNYGNGHINDTFLVDVDSCSDTKFILQSINTTVFKNTEQLMSNISNVTEFLREKIVKQGGDPKRETVNLVFTKNGKNTFSDDQGNMWRAMLFVVDTICLDAVENPIDFYETGVAFGNFQRRLSDYPAATLFETISDFHNTEKRLIALKNAIKEDKMGRACRVENEINFALQREDDTRVLTNLLNEGKLPLRVTHNDTKLNNVLLDSGTKKGICVIDLDTVMPGLSVHDFGDAIRYGANTGAEDDQDLNNVGIDLELFDFFTKGFVEGCAGTLTLLEYQMLTMGAKAMTLECGIRFLTDYLMGDTYFKTYRNSHNLDRCKAQFKLVADIEDKWQTLTKIVDKYI